MDTLEVLVKARELIANEAKWCTRDFAADSEGHGCGWSDSRACRWCARGAIRYVAPEAFRPAERALCAVAAAWEPRDLHAIVYVNDVLGHAATLTMFDRAIEAERSKSTPKGP